MSSVLNRPSPQHAVRPVIAVSGANARLVRPATVAPLRPAPEPSRARALLTRRNMIVVAVAFLVIMIGRLFISVGIDASAYQIAGLAKESQNLTRDAEFIQEQLDVLNSPQHLSDVAQGLGMIANPNPAYLRVSDGRRWGNAQVGVGGAIDHTQIANSLIDTLGVDAALDGVATPKKSGAAAESKSSTTAETLPASSETGSAVANGIPAPNTH